MIRDLFLIALAHLLLAGWTIYYVTKSSVIQGEVDTVGLISALVPVWNWIALWGHLGDDALKTKGSLLNNKHYRRRLMDDIKTLVQSGRIDRDWVINLQERVSRSQGKVVKLSPHVRSNIAGVEYADERPDSLEGVASDLIDLDLPLSDFHPEATYPLQGLRK